MKYDSSTEWKATVLWPMILDQCNKSAVGRCKHFCKFKLQEPWISPPLMGFSEQERSLKLHGIRNVAIVSSVGQTIRFSMLNTQASRPSCRENNEVLTQDLHAYQKCSQNN